MSDDKIAGDGRSQAQWIGDIAHRTLERLEELRPELANLARQFELMRVRWCYPQGASSAAFMLERLEEHLRELAGLSAFDQDGQAARVCRGIIADTGREKQGYHEHS